MQVINWLDLKLSQEEVLAVCQELGQIAPTRVFLKNLIRQIVMQYPWRDRSDTIDLFDPSKSYCADEYIAFPQEDPQELSPTSWKIGVIKEIVPASNPLQGAFQVLFVNIDGDLFTYASDIPDASPFEVHIPINDNDSLELFVNQNVNLYENSIISNLKNQASDFGIQISDNIIVIGEIQNVFTSDQLHVLDEIIKNQAKEKIIIRITQIIRDLENWDFNQYSELELKYLLEKYLSKNGFTELGNGQWIKSEDQQKLKRPIQKRPEVPRNTSILIDLLNITETELDEIKQSQLPGDVIPNILEYGDFQEDSGDSVATTWEPPSTEIKLPIVTYQNILEGFFNLSKELRKAFPPSEGYFIPNIQIGESEYLPFVVDYYENVLKTMDENGASILRQEIPHAGIKLWIEYQHNNNYRIFAKPLEKPVNHRCKIAKWDDDGNLQFEETEIPVRFEHEKNIFKAEIRLVDKKALFKEAEDIQYSIQDCVLLAFQELTEISADGLVHQNEVFNAVFFKNRMSSPHTVLSLLYKLPCFVPVGGGYFKFRPEFGLKVKVKTNYYQRNSDEIFRQTGKTKEQDQDFHMIISLLRHFNNQVLFRLHRKL
ncbi:MAG: hypothetical protein GX142_01260, partial [Chloroflexi bacterium]|nr:hypothetical protein [Chloroflexota bacterium]